MAEASSVRCRKALNDDSVRLVVGRPRMIQRKRREEVASILAQEILERRSIIDVRRQAARYGSFYVILRALKGTEDWEKLRSMAARSDILAALSLRYTTMVVLDILDRTVPLPASSVPERNLNGLVALTLIAWQRHSDVNMDMLARGVEEFESSDVRGEALGALESVMKERLSVVVEQMESYMEMLEMMKKMLPSGDDETFVEEVFQAYMQNIESMAQLLRQRKDLQRIIDLMGKLDVEYGAKQEKAKSFTTTEAYDLGLSKDIRHILPVELVKLQDPILRLLFFSKVLEGGLLTYQLKGLDDPDDPLPKKKGPVIALIDASGSMFGEPEILAKAFILMLAKRMEREGRDIKVILFAASDWKLEIDLADKKRVAKNLLDLMVRHFEGYTDFNSALRVGLENVKGKEWHAADVILFTDGESNLNNEDLINEWNDFKLRTSSKIYTLIVNNDTAGGLEQVSDKIWKLPMGKWDVEGSPSGLIKLIAQG
jgi:uncharacterized protein with von Willebrand factor type A (vWA) domain